MVKFIVAIVIITLLVTVVWALKGAAEHAIKESSKSEEDPIPSGDSLTDYIEGLKTKIAKSEVDSKAGIADAEAKLDLYKRQLSRAQSLTEKTKDL